MYVCVISLAAQVISSPHVLHIYSTLGHRQPTTFSTHFQCVDRRCGCCVSPLLCEWMCTLNKVTHESDHSPHNGQPCWKLWFTCFSGFFCIFLSHPIFACVQFYFTFILIRLHEGSDILINRVWMIACGLDERDCWLLRHYLFCVMSDRSDDRISGWPDTLWLIEWKIDYPCVWMCSAMCQVRK